MTTVRIKHLGKRFKVTVDEGKVTVRRLGWLIPWKAQSREMETVSNLLAKILSETWPGALRQDVLTGIRSQQTGTERL